jgi:hypothetical protein
MFHDIFPSYKFLNIVPILVFCYMIHYAYVCKCIVS